MQKFKNILLKVVSGASAAYSYLEGKKRRIALAAGIGMKLFKPYTIAATVCEYTFYILGGTDAAGAATKFVKNKLPGGIRK